MACKNVCRLCDRLIISSAVTFTAGTGLVIDIPAGAYTVEVREGGTPVQVYEEKDGKKWLLINDPAHPEVKAILESEFEEIYRGVSYIVQIRPETSSK